MCKSNYPTSRYNAPFTLSKTTTYKLHGQQCKVARVWFHAMLKICYHWRPCLNQIKDHALLKGKNIALTALKYHGKEQPMCCIPFA